MRRSIDIILAVLVFAVLVLAAAFALRPGERPGLTGRSSAPRTCGLAASPDAVAGWTAHIDEGRCVSFALPDALPAPSADAPSSLQVLDPSDLSSYLAFDVRDAASPGGCHVEPFAFGGGCVDASTVRASYARIDGAMNEAYLGPEVRARCDVGVDCVVREAHVFAPNDRWLVATVYVAASRYDRGFERQFIDIVRTIDAR